MVEKVSSRWPVAVTAMTLMLLALGPVWAEWSDRGYLVATFTRIAILGLAAMSLDLVVGYGGMVSMGHAAFFAFGAYTAGAASYHLIDGSSFLGLPGTDQVAISWPLAMLVGALLGLIIGGLSLRTRGVYFIMTTLAFNQMVFFLLNALEIYGGDDGVSLLAADRRIGPFTLNEDLSYFSVCFVVLVVVVVVLMLLIRSPFGRVLRGCHDNEQRMQALGYKTYRYRLAAFVISAALTSLAGAMAVGESQFLSPAVAHWTRSGELLVMVIVGGLGSLIGGVIGAAALILLEEAAIDYTDNWQFFVGLGLLAVVLVAPKGIAGLILRGHRNV